MNQRPFTEITTMCEEILPLYTGPCEVVCSDPVYSLESPQTTNSVMANKDKVQKTEGQGQNNEQVSSLMNENIINI